ATRAGLGAASTSGIAALQGSDPGQAAILGGVSPIAGAVARGAGQAAMQHPDVIKEMLPFGVLAEEYYRHGELTKALVAAGLARFVGNPRLQAAATRAAQNAPTFAQFVRNLYLSQQISEPEAPQITPPLAKKKPDTRSFDQVIADIGNSRVPLDR